MPKNKRPQSIVPVAKPSKKTKKAAKAASKDDDGGNADLPTVDGVPIPRSFLKHLQQPADAKPKKKKKPDSPRGGDDEAAAPSGGGGVQLLAVAHAAASAPPSLPTEAETGLEIVAKADRSDKAARFVRWMLAPIEPADFVRRSYGRRPVHIARDERGYYDGWFSTAELERQLRECSLRWTEEVDAARYRDGTRTTHNGEGVARAGDVRALYDDGCSIRLSWPQRHSDPLWAMLTQLEEFFGSGSGANVYATPAGSQGFAPHWDDIDAFVLQLEGTKHWRVYAPRSEAEELPRFSSPNLSADELGPLLADVTLRPGDLLYLPRGFVHQAMCGDDASLHLTASVGRMHSWRDLLETGLTGVLEMLTAERRAWRETLPPDYLDAMGVLHANDEDGAGGGEGWEEDDEEEGGEGGDGAEGGSVGRSPIQPRQPINISRIDAGMVQTPYGFPG